MWALGRARITNVDALGKLAEFQRKKGFESTLWVLPSHLKSWKSVMLPDETPLQLPSSLFRSDSPKAFPFVHLNEELKKSIVFCAPPPAAAKDAQILDKGQDENAYFWREAQPEEFLHASFFFERGQEQRLLCSTTVGEVPAVPDTTLDVLNSQQCSNHFLIDGSLRHINMITREEFPPQFRGGLTTIAAQFQYTKFEWVLAEEVKDTHFPYLVPENVVSHTVIAEEGISLLHVSQLSPERQSELIARVPRFVLLEGFEKPFVYSEGRWTSPYRLKLQEKLRAKDVPARQGSGTASKEPLPLLWVTADQESGYTGLPQLRHSVRVVRFYHASQLVPKNK